MMGAYLALLSFKEKEKPYFYSAQPVFLLHLLLNAEDTQIKYFCSDLKKLMFVKSHFFELVKTN